MTATDYGAWRAAAERTLRDKSLESLVRKDEDGVAVEPLYAAETPGGAARVVAAIPPGPIRASRSWLVGQCYQRPSVAEAAREIARDASSGVEAFVIVLDRALRLGLSAHDPRAHELVGKGGVAVASSADLAALLEAIPPGAHVFVDAGGNGARIANLSARAFSARGITPSDVAFMAAIDPLGALASEGRLPRPMADIFDEARQVKRTFPRGRALVATGLPYHEAGATLALELGAIAATLLEYLRAGFEVADVAVAVAADGEVLRGIAKARALRLLVAKVCAATGVAPAQPFVLGVTSKRHLAVRDRESNMVRGTVETFALAAGGADAIVTRAFDLPTGGVEGRAKRVGKNTQLILRDESEVGHCADPARGSFAAEAMTLALAEAGWNAMRAVEGEGGMARSLLGGAMQARVARAHEERQAALAKRKRVIVGVTEFAPGEYVAPSGWALRDEERTRERERGASEPRDSELHASSPNQGESAIRLDRVRDAERFEGLRGEADALAVSGHRPSVLVAPLGARAEHRARVEFTTRLFEVGGFDVRVSALAEPDKPQPEGAAPDVVVVASSDAVYAASGAEALRSARAMFPRALVILAGKRGLMAEALAAVAPSGDIFLGMDVVSFLAEVLHGVRVTRSGASSQGGAR